MIPLLLHPSIDDALYPLLFFVSFCRATHAHSKQTLKRENKLGKYGLNLMAYEKKGYGHVNYFFSTEYTGGSFVPLPPSFLSRMFDWWDNH